jgi:hypothetical protein
MNSCKERSHLSTNNNPKKRQEKPKGKEPLEQPNHQFQLFEIKIRIREPLVFKISRKVKELHRCSC